MLISILTFNIIFVTSKVKIHIYGLQHLFYKCSQVIQKYNNCDFNYYFHKKKSKYFIVILNISFIRRKSISNNNSRKLISYV
jgi:hypothetical protein